MATSDQNVAVLKDAYRQWHETKGQSVKVWLDLVADDVKIRSLAAGGPAAPFTQKGSSKKEFEQYFNGLLAEWSMVNYKTTQFVAQGDWVAMLGSTAWTNRKTGREVDTPKADFFKFRDGKIVEFYELYDTAALVAAAQP